MLERIFGRRGAADWDSALAALGRYSFAPQTLAGLHTYLATAPPADLALIRAEDVATRLDLDPPVALELLATAVHEGLLDLHWDAHCPGCTAASTSWPTLAQARGEAHCAHCQVDYPVHLDETIRVHFSLNARYAGRRSNPRNDIPLMRAANSTVTGLDLLNVAAFRDLLTQQILPPHENLLVQRVTILFTDLRGSTALYAEKGDPRAYSLVSEHFTILTSAVSRERGAVVKTIGDSIMATFTEPAAGLRAALAMQRGITQFNQDRRLTATDALLLKVGLHAGPCIAVTMNGRMDYFGTAVNVAARVEGLSQGNDIVLTDAVLRDPAAAAVVARALDSGAEQMSFTAPLRGLREPVSVHRLALPETQAALTPAGALVASRV